MTIRRCSTQGCDRPASVRGLCKGHYRRLLEGSQKTGPIGTAVVLNDGIYMPCPGSCLELAAACAELDAQAIVRAIWPHLLEASLVGLEPFTLQPEDAA
jgi:hypothetical protein